MVAFGDNPGELEMFVYAPAEVPLGAPLVVALHGCTQQAADFDDETGLKALADEVPFVLLLPQQREANNSERCFNWFHPEDNRPGEGESASLRAMIHHATTEFETDPGRVYVLGLSAGGSMSAVLLANYPDVFAGGAVIAGTPFDCNRPTLLTGGWWWFLNAVGGDAASATFACGLLGNRPTDRNGADWGAAVRIAAGATPDSWPVVSLWQGRADSVVHPRNQEELLEQWANVHGIDTEADMTETVGGAVREVFTDATGQPRVETWRLDGFPHAIAVDPDAEPTACGFVGAFIEDAGICSTRRILRFWELVES